MRVYTYRSKKTGRIVTSDRPLSSKDFTLVTRIANGQMKGASISKK